MIIVASEYNIQCIIHCYSFCVIIGSVPYNRRLDL